MPDEVETYRPPRRTSWPAASGIAKYALAFVLPTIGTTVALYTRFVLLEQEVTALREELSEHVARGSHRSTDDALQSLLVRQAEMARDLEGLSLQVQRLDRGMTDRLDSLGARIRQGGSR